VGAGQHYAFQPGNVGGRRSRMKAGAVRRPSGLRSRARESSGPRIRQSAAESAA